MCYLLYIVNFSYGRHFKKSEDVSLKKKSIFLDSVETRLFGNTTLRLKQLKSMTQHLLLQIAVFATVYFIPHLASFAYFCCLSSPCKHLGLSPLMFIKSHLDLAAVFLTNTLNLDLENQLSNTGAYPCVDHGNSVGESDFPGH